MAVFATRIAARLKGCEVLLLQGELGAGKTTFTRALARALGIKARTKSPTFTLMHIHEVAKGIRYRAKSKTLRPKPYAIRYLVHCDAYRIKSASELEDVGLMDYVGRPDTVVVVEWGEKIKPLLKGRRYTLIKFAHGKNEQERILRVVRHPFRRAL